jgi:poly(A) polymerase
MVTREQLVELFSGAGHEFWLVGGALRDRLLGRPTHDMDYATSAAPDEVEALLVQAGVRISTVGQRFGTIGALVVADDGTEAWSEITTFRGESYAAGTRWPETTFGASIAEDLARRDFTVNALAENAVSGEVLDLYGGGSDLRAGRLRAVGEPAERFREDPLRILRGLRFVSQLGFTIEPATFDGMRETVDLLPTLSQERLTAEIDRLLTGAWVTEGLRALEAAGALPFILPELAAMVGCEQNRYHRFDVWGHTVATVGAIAVTPETVRVRRWTALLHDVGKPPVRHVKANGEWGFYRHETVGSQVAADMLARLRMASADARLIALLVRRHMDRPVPEDARTVRRFMSRIPEHWRELLALKRADNASHTYDDSAYHDALEAACLRVEIEEGDRLRAESPLSGDDLVELFEREPGPWVGVIKRKLSTLVLDGDLAPGDRESAARIARRMLNRAERAARP